MTTRLSFTANPSAACWHAAEQLALGGTPAVALTAERLAANFAEPAAALAAFLTAANIPQPAFFDQLTPAACEIDGNRQLAHAALTKTVGRSRAEPLLESLVGLLSDCENAYFAAFPDLRKELELRYGPLRELWDARGPGLLAAVGRATDRRLVPEAVSVAAVPPFGAQGGGWAALGSNTVVFEMVLADPIAGLPETVRLGWLVSQLNIDLPDFSELLAPGAARLVAACAMLPVVLEAAADLEMMRPDEGGHLLTTAAEAWLPAALKSPELKLSESRLAALCGWRESARASGVPWGVKLKALERLLAEAADE
ncbi:MAG: hypothetical protein JNK76_16785 [Planctomycetales bacterium]|nr:hypothetical protein [Planctomycetales bacterium]MBN8624545.1 hypothetical protein [Planctomycetota bacterium]